ncbi:WW domain binding 1-like [Pelobates cultripes]|uniref:WW domain binding 1-like n=1 Tax=Pelobates cultripes TaxID=61616 RepID=A0AAD1S2G4_PELCU|nr:WW domain binding 1-like [Pelobates cultripes]
MELYWYIIVIIFIIIKIFFYVCWYRSRQRQLDAYLSNPRNAQIVIVGGRAYLHQLCEQRQNAAVWANWYGVQEDSSVGEPSATLPPAPSYSQLEVPPPYEAISAADDLKPPPYSELAHDITDPDSDILNVPENYDACSLSEAPPPYTATIVIEESAVTPYSPSVVQTTSTDSQYSDS